MANRAASPSHGWHRAFRLQLIDAAGFACAVGYGVLAWLARQPGEPPLPAFFAIVGCAFALTVTVFACHGRTGKPVPVARLLLWALVFRVCGLIGGPFYEDDFFRYLWDAFRFAADGTPYGAAPEAFFVDPAVPPAFQAVLDEINHPHLATIYGPVTQLAFLLGYAVSPASVAVLQAEFILVDLLLVCLLLRLAPARAVLLYAWCPLVVKEIAFTAHPDVLCVLLLLAAVLAAGRQRLKTAAVLLGLSVGAKVIALLLVPFVLMRARAKHWAWFAATVALVYAPFVLQGGTDLATLAIFAEQWRFNAAAFGVLADVFSAEHARLVAGVGLLAFCCWRYRVERRAGNAVPRGDLLFGALLLLSPVVNPWYLVWLLPFAAIHPSAWAWMASAAVLLSYVTGLNLADVRLGAYEQPVWVRPLEYGLIALALCGDLLWPRLRRRLGNHQEPCTEG